MTVSSAKLATHSWPLTKIAQAFEGGAVCANGAPQDHSHIDGDESAKGMVSSKRAP